MTDLRNYVYVTDADHRSPDEPEVAILVDGQLCVGGERRANPCHFGSTLRPGGTSHGLNGERIERWVEIGPRVTLRRITTKSDSWWDVAEGGP
jgi:hypothetical protein